MKKKISLILIILSSALFAYAQTEDQSFFDHTDQFLKEYVKNGKVNYSALSQDHDRLDRLVMEIAEMDLTGKSQNFKKAFYINSYNLMVIKGVLANYPVESPMNIDRFFDVEIHKVAGKTYSLNQLEFEELFKNYKDLRLHFVLNCGAVSCPTLYSEAITESEIEEQLRFSTTMVMDRDDYVKVDHKEDKIYVSKIFDWYNEMFAYGEGSVRKYINYNRFEFLPRDYEIVFFEYDWTLNDLK